MEDAEMLLALFHRTHVECRQYHALDVAVGFERLSVQFDVQQCTVPGVMCRLDATYHLPVKQFAEQPVGHLVGWEKWIRVADHFGCCPAERLLCGVVPAFDHT